MTVALRVGRQRAGTDGRAVGALLPEGVTFFRVETDWLAFDGGGLGETIGVALAGLGFLLGKVYGPRVERRFFRAFFLVGFGSMAVVLVVGLIWWAVVGGSGGGGEQESAASDEMTIEEMAASVDYCVALLTARAAFLGVGSVSPEDLDELAGNAPEEIRTDVNTLAQALTTYTEEVGDDPTVLERAAALDSLSPETAAAERRLDAWEEENCTG